MFSVNISSIYEELFRHKIRKYSKILLVNRYDNIFDSINVIKEHNLSIHCICVEPTFISEFRKKADLEEYSEKLTFDNEDIYDALYDNGGFDIIIFFDLFSDYNEEDIKYRINKAKLNLNKKGKIIFINNIITQYSQYIYHPLSYLRSIFVNCVYISDVYDKIRQNELYVKDCYRLSSIDIPTYPIEYFSITCGLDRY